MCGWTTVQMLSYFVTKSSHEDSSWAESKFKFVFVLLNAFNLE